MVSYFLNKKNYIKELQSISDLSILKISNKEGEYIKPMKCLIEYFNLEYKWDNMFTLEDCKTRLLNENILFILYFNFFPIGYVWFKKINEDVCFGYNLYVTKKISRPNEAPKWFYNKVSEIMLKEYEKINVEIEDWNKVVFDIVESIGYKKIN